jgi:hypothetical protein
MLTRCLSGKIRMSFSEIAHALFVIQSHMREAYEKYSNMALEVLREQECQSWCALDVGCGSPYEAHEMNCILEADKLLKEFQQRFSYFLESCCFYFWMQTNRTFSRLRLK